MQQAVISDPKLTLKEWKNFIELLIVKFGEDANMFTDSGYNNCELIVEKKDIKKEHCCD
jgi:hypothetical protein